MSKRNFPPSIKVVIEGTEYQAELRDFKTGSKGYFVGAKMPFKGERLQVGINLTFIGSKEW